ncbi:hypothetical protein [Zhongshania sp.]|uniref:hypothetical protein n=1 Tax=Zhongshania sp. TaxID=1971902 RepID=UPI003567E7B3
MTDVTNNNIEVSGEPLYEASPYQVFTKADLSGYVVLNKDTGVYEVEDKVLGKCITFAEHSAAFLEDALAAPEEDNKPDISIYPASAMPKGKLN